MGAAWVHVLSDDMTDLAKVRQDFDRIALLSDSGGGGGADHNARYHDRLLRHVPRGCSTALEIGSGTGGFARALAPRCGRVVGVDLSPNMVRVARALGSFSNVEYRVADVMTHDLGEASFDCIASIATLHHLPAADLLPRLVRACGRAG